MIDVPAPHRIRAAVEAAPSPTPKRRPRRAEPGDADLQRRLADVLGQVAALGAQVQQVAHGLDRWTLPVAVAVERLQAVADAAQQLGQGPTSGEGA